MGNVISDNGFICGNSFFILRVTSYIHHEPPLLHIRNKLPASALSLRPHGSFATNPLPTPIPTTIPCYIPVDSLCASLLCQLHNPRATFNRVDEDIAGFEVSITGPCTNERYVTTARRGIIFRVDIEEPNFADRFSGRGLGDRAYVKHT
jgi:hypothetical protein